MLRRRPILTALSLLLLIAGSALALFVYTFDLNRYRSTIEKHLSQQFNQPVSLGGATLNLRPGLTLEFSEVRLGEPNQPFTFNAERLLVQLKLRPLLQKQIVFDEIVLQSPKARVQLPPPETHPPAQSDLRPEKIFHFLQSASLQLLAVEKGALTVADPRHPKRALTLTGLNGRLAGLKLGTPASLSIEGELVQGLTTTKLGLMATLELPEDPQSLAASPLELALGLGGLRLEPLLTEHFPAESRAWASGEASLQLHLQGGLEAGFSIAAKLSGDNLGIRPGAAYAEPIAIDEASLEGRWRKTKGEHLLENFKLTVDSLAIEGNARLSKGAEGTWIEGSLKTASLPASELQRLLPIPFKALKNAQLGGALTLQEARIAGPLSKPELQQASLSLKNGTFSAPSLGAVEKTELLLTFSNNRLQIAKGQAQVEHTPVRLSGHIDQPFSAHPQLALEVQATPAADRLLALLPEGPRSDWQATGAIPLSLKLSGEPRRIEAALQADLDKIALRRGKSFELAEGSPGRLEARAVLQPQSINLQQARLSLPPLDLEAQGTLNRNQALGFALVLDLQANDLRQAPSLLPFLRRMRPSGRLSAHFRLDGTRSAIGTRSGQLQLEDVSLHLTSVIADLQKVNGTINLEHQGLRTHDLRAQLGSSAVQIEARLDNYAAPRLELRVRSPQVRASDLMFHAKSAMLRDLDGQLTIDRQGLYFNSVKVRLDGGTTAVVRGSVSNFKAPQTRLEIEAAYGNIDEVIALWKGPARPRSAAPVKRPAATAPPLVIQARAHRGNLYGLNFQNAEGTIALHNKILSIHPLHFVVNDGYCVGQVVVDPSEAPPSLLKVSGHLENFDAAPVYQDLLRRRGLVSGSLRADFYLQGRLGSDFLPSSSGGANLEVKNGVLRKFKGLSKVFSLLNVSQIFALQLPDMASEGMPFNKLTANFRLNQGTLTTEDLFIDSNAMNLSLVGDLDLKKNQLDFILGVKPLRTVDKIVTKIPLAGWLLTGEEKALITAHFQILGPSRNPEVLPLPINSVGEKVLGIFKRAFNLPGKVVSDLEKMIESQQ